MKRVIMVASEGREFAGLLARARNVRKLDLLVQFSYLVELDGQQWVLVADGPGPRLARRAVETASMKGEPAVVVSMGYCGALDPELPLYAIVSASNIEDGGRCWPCLTPPVARNGFVSGTIVSLDRVIGTPSAKVCLRTNRQSAVEMEAAGLGEWSAAHGVPFYCVRVVTDRADEGFSLDFNRLRDREGRFSRVRIAAMAARNPVKYVPDLIRLNRRCRVAAGLLGDFLADCRF
ncbi:MAG: hypothetical protein IT160_20655 [Bryobacterales bacterium]|nr:hypothetical protein [Bryobacterales bacterium]